MNIIIFWLVVSLIVGLFASSNGRSGLGYFLLSIIISPLLAGIIVLIVGKNPIEIQTQSLIAGEKIKCHYCKKAIKSESKVCEHCKNEL